MNKPKYILRFPTLMMRQYFKAQAKAQGRTMNAHLIHILTEHVTREQHQIDGHSRPKW